MSTQRVADFLRRILRNTWVSVVGLTCAMALNLVPVHRIPGEVFGACMSVTLLICAVGPFVCVYRQSRGHLLPDLISVVISLYASLVGVFLAAAAGMIGD